MAFEKPDPQIHKILTIVSFYFTEVQLLKLMPGNLTVPATLKTGKPVKRVPKKEAVEAMMAPPVWIPTVSLIPIGMKFVRTSMTCTCVKSSFEAFTPMVRTY